MLKKQAARKQDELQQALASGMLQEKGMGKKKRRQKESQRQNNLGLYEVIQLSIALQSPISQSTTQLLPPRAFNLLKIYSPSGKRK